jgi:hypothetical protein
LKKNDIGSILVLIIEKSKPAGRQGRKAMDLKNQIARLPKVNNRGSLAFYFPDPGKEADGRNLENMQPVCHSPKGLNSEGA